MRAASSGRPQRRSQSSPTRTPPCTGQCPSSPSSEHLAPPTAACSSCCGCRRVPATPGGARRWRVRSSAPYVMDEWMMPTSCGKRPRSPVDKLADLEQQAAGDDEHWRSSKRYFTEVVLWGFAWQLLQCRQTTGGAARRGATAAAACSARQLPLFCCCRCCCSGHCQRLQQAQLQQGAAPAAAWLRAWPDQPSGAVRVARRQRHAAGVAGQQ